MNDAQRSVLRDDAMAGLTAALVLVPQALAYAMLAGLPPTAGLHAATFAVFVYALFGRSAALAIGPVATDSLLTGAALAALAPLDPTRLVGLAGVLALMVGGIQLLLGVLRLGSLTNLLSLPVLLGFTAAAAILVVVQQLPSILGLSPPPSREVVDLFAHLYRHFGETSGKALLLFGLTVAIPIVLTRHRPKWPRAPIALLASTLIALLVPWFDDVRRVGAVPRSVPWPALVPPSSDEIFTLLPHALTIAAVAYLEAHSVAKRFEERFGEPDPSAQLRALGATNLTAGVTGGFPITGGLGRSAVFVNAGARTRLAGVITGALVLLVTLFLSPGLAVIPRPALDAIVVSGVLSLIDVEAMKSIAKVSPVDAGAMVLTLLATLVFSFQIGILVGIGAALVAFIFGTTRPHIAVLARIPGTYSYRNQARYPEAVPVEGMLLVRVDSQLYFGNSTFLKAEFARLEAAAGEVRAIVLDASGIGQLDSTAEAALARLIKDYDERGIVFALASVRGPVRDVLRRSGLWQRLGRGRLFLDVHSAVEALSPKEGIQRLPHALSPVI